MNSKPIYVVKPDDRVRSSILATTDKDQVAAMLAEDETRQYVMWAEPRIEFREAPGVLN